MPHVNLDNPEGVVGYWTSGGAIRVSDLRRRKLNPNQFERLTRAGYNTLVIQCMHLNSAYGNRRQLARKALRTLYAYGASQGASLICGDFNRAAYRASTGPQVNLSDSEHIHNSQSSMAAEEYQYLVDSINKGIPLKQRVGLQFRNANPMAATHRRMSRGEEKGLHGPHLQAFLDTMLMLHVSWPFFKQHEAYREAYQRTTVRDLRQAFATCEDDGSDLPSNCFPSPAQLLRNDLVLQMTHRSLFRLDVDVASHLSSKTLSKNGTQKRVPQQYSNDHSQLICSISLRQPKGALKITQGQRSATGWAYDKERRPEHTTRAERFLSGSRTLRGSSASASDRPSAQAIAHPSTENAPWAYFVPTSGAITGPPPKAKATAASAANERAQSTPAPPSRPVRPAADAMVNYHPTAKRHHLLLALSQQLLMQQAG